MKLVVLDGYLPGFDGLRLTVGPEHQQAWHDFTPPEETAARIGDAEAVFTNRAVLDGRTLEACPRLKYIGTLGTGYNMVDLAAASRLGITVCNAPGYSTKAVAQAVFALLLEIVSRTSVYSRYVKDGRWTDPTDPGLTAVPMQELAGKTMGIVGMGAIGREVAVIARAFGMEVLACRRSAAPAGAGVPLVDLDTLLSRSDIVSLHCPLTGQTAGMINRDTIAKMKPGVILLNTARGGLIQEHDVAKALDSGHIYMLGADVLTAEPPGPRHPLAEHPRTVITPHVAWMARETRKRQMQVVSEAFLAFAGGNPIHVVNG